jgi:RHS repeat-associated protein
MKTNSLLKKAQRIIAGFAVIILFGSAVYGQTGNTLQNPIVAGTFSSDFQYSNSQNTANFTNAYTAGRSTNDVYHKFTLSKPMTVVITHCGSTLGDTYMSLLNSAGTLFDSNSKNDDYSGEGQCSSIRHSYIKRDLPAGAYYAVSEGYNQNGVIKINISGQPLPGNTLQNPIVAGTFGSAFQYSNSQNTTNFSNDLTNRSPNDVFYKFTLTKKMDVAMSHCGSETNYDTYMHLLDASGKSITTNDDYSGDETCSSFFRHSFLYRSMDPGTYYIVSEGYNGSGTITTNIRGFDSEFNYPEQPNAYNPDPATEPGLITGAFNVSATGAATYTIPIEVPAGVGGMQPSVAIEYNSQGGNGTVGWGCNLTGISAITRAPKNIYYDGLAKGLTHSTDEAYLLDGQRLILYSGTAGTNNAVYYSESDPFTKVTVHGTGSSAWFEVSDKNGAIFYYGNSSSARQTYTVNSTSKINAWYMDYVEDVLGNYMKYTYTNSNYFYRLSSITYGKNKNISSTFENRINFEYEYRTDAIPFMLETVKGSLSYRLRRITCKTGTETFREYILGYTNSDHFSRLTSVTEKNGAGEALKPTILEWSYIPQVYYNGITPSMTGLKSNTKLEDQYYTSADLNGDGVSDIIGFTTNYKHSSGYLYTLVQHFISNRQTDGSYKYVAYNPRYLPSNIDIAKIKHSQGLAGLLSFNALGDGKQYILTPFYLKNNWGPQVIFFVHGYNGQEIVPSPDTKYPIELQRSNGLPLYATGDVYNQGKDVIVFIEKGPDDSFSANADHLLNPNYAGKVCELVSLSTSTNPVPLYTWVNFNFNLPSKPEKLFLADFNGNGMNDMLIFYKGGYNIYWNQGGKSPYAAANNKIETSIMYESVGKNCPFSAANKSTYTNIGDVKMIRMGDFNGDGLPDFIMNATDDSNWYFALNKGDGTFTKQLACTLDIYDHDFTTYDNDKFNCYVFDFDHDGKSDIVINKGMYVKKQEKVLFIVFSTWGEFTQNRTCWMRSTGTELKQVAFATSGNQADALDRYTLGDFNGDGKIELLGYGYDCYNGTSTRTMRMYRNTSLSANSGMLTSITDGYGSKTSVIYAPLTGDIYAKGSGSVYPVMDCALPVQAVKSVTMDNGAAGSVSLNYKYANAKLHLTGKGLLGITQTVTNTTAGTATESGMKSLNLTYFAPEETYTKTTVGSATAETSVKYTFVNKGGKKYFMYPNTKTEKDLDKNTVTTTYKYDTDYGNITEEKTVWSSNMYRTVTYGDYIKAGGTMKNKPQLITEVSKHADDGQTFTRKTSITYNTTKGYPTKKVENYGSSLPLTTEYTNYDNFGNLKSYKVSGKDLSTVTYNMDYDPTNRFVAKTYSSPAFTVTSFTYNTFGNVLTEKDETNSSAILTTTHSYNKWGRRTSTLAPDGTKTVYSTGWGNSTSSSNYNRYFTLVESKGQPWVKTWYDKKGRELSVETVGAKGMSIKTANTYNSKGLLSRTQTTQCSLTLSKTFTYDERNRLTNESSSNGQSSAYTYGNRKITTTVAGKAYTKTYDAWGGIKQITDPETTVAYTYHSTGNPSKVSAAGADFSMTYDDAGNQKTLKDPNAGTVTYTYNAAAQVKTQVDGKGKKTEHFPDNLNRNAYSTIDGVRTDYAYGDSGYDLHRLTQVKTGNNTVNYTYDKYGRLITEKRQIDGSGQLDFEYKYNSNGQLETLVYPDNMQVKQEYDAYGNLIKVSAGTQAVWELTGNTGLTTTATLGGTMTATNYYNSQGLLTGQKTVKGSTVLRNMGYVFNSSTGNLDSRTGMISQTETFFYDNLDRLNSIKHAGTEVMKINYKPNGNIANKTGLGTYSYLSDKPHAISGVDNTNGLISAEEQEILYTAFNKAYNIKEIVNDDAYELNITYGPDQQRWKSELKKNNVITKTTIYAGDYEKITENGVTRQLYYLHGGGIYVKQTGQADKIYYAHKDHLGNILSLTDNTGAAVFKANYDVWGKQTVTTNTFKFHRGFTGHEHLPEFSLINMNGRMYDPILGRFLSPDPYVQAPEFSQNFNRYSYCLNNPLLYTDPSGEVWFAPIIVGAIMGGMMGTMNAQMNDKPWYQGLIWGALIGAGTAYLSGFAPTNWIGSTLYGSGLGAASGAGMAYATGGDVKQAAIGGAIFGGIMGFTSSDQFKNMTRRQGFKNNDKVLKNFVNKEEHQKALEYFGFKGQYDPDNPLFNKVDGGASAITHPKTGEIFYNESAFNYNYDRLKFIANHELIHSQNVLSGKFNGIQIDRIVRNEEEWSTYMKNYKRQGLYPKHGFDIAGSINIHGYEAEIYGITIFPGGSHITEFNKQWWHFIYRIPRRF